MSTALATKVCEETGEWGRHPQSNRTWTNFTDCKANPAHHHGKVRADGWTCVCVYVCLLSKI